MKYILFLFLFISGLQIFAQRVESFQKVYKQKVLFKDSLVLSEFPITPHSVYIYCNDRPVDVSFFTIDMIRSTLKSSKIFHDSLTIFYTTLPLYKSSKHKFSSTNPSKTIPSRFNTMYTQGMEDESEIQYSGSFIRGITVGNRQSASINSGFNLNLSGKLSNGLEINATMTDENMLIQPEGNSASIQEFDRIFISLKKDSHKIILGDFDIRNPSNLYFMKFDRKLQGISYNTAINLKKNLNLELDATVGITRGTFARNTIVAQENNQGPYKLFGNNGESFIVIIAGSEKVFVNGQLMKRGLDADYIINYNMGEVVFMPNRLITRDLRIIVEFQYSDRNYFRYTINSGLNLKSDKIHLFSNLFTENDDKNNQINYSLNKTQIARLSEIGNQLDSAFVSSEVEFPWEGTRILYLKKDTIVAGISYPIYQWAEEKSSPVYQLVFTMRGLHQGNYVLKPTAANGSVYQWVAPIAGVMQGSYEPNIRISTPKTHLQWTSGGEFRWTSSQKTNVEISYTDNDLNTFSPLDQEKNKGFAAKVQHRIQARIDSTKTLSIGLDQEYTNANFSPLTRYRNNEFQRDWSLNLPIRNEIEQSITNLNLGYQSRYLQSSFHSSLFYMPNYYSGLQSVLDGKWEKNKWKFSTVQSFLSVTKHDSSIAFYRPRASVQYLLDKKKSNLDIGFYHEMYRNTSISNFLNSSSFYWKNYFFNWNQMVSNRNSFTFQYIYRTEQLADSLDFLSPHTISHTFSLDGKQDFSEDHSIKYILKYRNFSSIISNQEINQYYLGRLDYNGNILKNFIRLNTNYEVRAGREQKMQLTYLKSPNGFGNYAWKDLNNNGVFELNEAYVSPIMTENNYVKFFIVLPEFLPSNEVMYSQNIVIHPKALFYSKKDWTQFLSKFQYSLHMDIHRKVKISQATNILDFGNPFATFNDTMTIFSRDNMYHQLSFQKFEKNIGLDLEWQTMNVSNLLSNGVDGNSSESIAIKSRIVLNHFLTYFGKIQSGHRSNRSEFFSERNFKIIENGIDNSLSCMVNQNVKINLIGNYMFKSTGNQFSVSQLGELELKIARKNDGIIESKFSVMNLNYESNISNPQVELSMLNGIQRGMNYIWNLTLGQKITKFLQLNIIYNGRKNVHSDQFIHSGNAEVRAIF